MAKFIYVVGEEARDKMLAMKYELLKSNENSHVYVFADNGNKRFSTNEFSFVLSDTLTF